MAKKKSMYLSMLAILPLLLVLACGELGKVDQGRVVEYDKEKGTITIIRDMRADPKNPDYSHLPPMTYVMPKDPGETGPAPKAGKRMKLDATGHTLTLYDPAAQNFKTIAYTLVEQKDKVDKDDPLVFDKTTDKPKKFPMVDRDKKTITVYSKRQKILTTFSVPDEYFSLPDNTWEAGDEVRIYFKQAGIAQRFMNISKTDIYKK